MDDQCRKIVLEGMLSQDTFSKYLGIEIDSVNMGEVKAFCRARSEMCNGFGIIHGGILFSFADSVMAFCANTLGYLAVTKTSTIKFLKPTKPEAMLVATAKCHYVDQKMITVTCQIQHRDGIVAELEAQFKQTDQLWSSLWSAS